MAGCARFVFSATCALLLTLLAVAANAQTSIDPVKGRVVTLKVPFSALESDGFLFGSRAPIYAAAVAGTEAAVIIGGRDDWQTTGFPSLLHMRFEKVSRKREHVEVELRSAIQPAVIGAVKFRFPPNTTNLGPLLAHLVIAGPPTEEAAKAYLDSAYQSLARKFFDDGPLATLSLERKLALVRFAHLSASGTTMSSETYKGNTYLVVDLGRDTNVYNELRLNQSARLARVMNDKLLAILKAFAKPVEGAAEVYGLKLEYRIPHKSFLEEYALPDDDALNLYAPSELIRKFADADITNQEFVNGCVAIVNDNRVQVPLSAAVP